MVIAKDLKWIPYGKNKDLDKLVDDEEDVSNRLMSAQTGYGLDKLVYDTDWGVRQAVALKGFGLDILIDDKNKNVREIVALYKYGLNKLIYDNESSVRQSVAMCGYGLDKLLYDTDKDVQDTANDYLLEHNLTIKQWREEYPDKCIYSEEEWEEIQKEHQD